MNEFCWANKLEGIGTYEQYAEEHCENIDEEKCFELYKNLAKLEQKQMIFDGCLVRSDGIQLVIHDENIVEVLKFKKI